MTAIRSVSVGAGRLGAPRPVTVARCLGKYPVGEPFVRSAGGPGLVGLGLGRFSGYGRH